VSEFGETRAELIALAQTKDYDVSATQLANWHRYGLIPRPVQVSLGKGHGTQSVYPTSTGTQLLALCHVHKTEKRLDHVAWHLWWEGYDVSLDAVRTFLGSVMDQLDSDVRQLVDMANGDLSDVAWEWIEHALSARLPKLLSGARKRVGRKHFDTFLTVLFTVSNGIFEGPHADAEEADFDRRILEKGFGLQRARTDRIGGIAPWLPSSWVGEALGAASRFLGTRCWADELAMITDMDLVYARDEVRSLLKIFGAYSARFDRIFGRGAFGFSVLGKMIRSIEAPEQAACLLMWAIARFRKFDELQGLEIYQRVAPGLIAGLKSWDLLDQLTSEIPGLAAILTTQEVATAVRDPEKMEHVLSRLSQFHALHGEDLDAFWTTHPEYRNVEEEQNFTCDTVVCIKSKERG